MVSRATPSTSIGIGPIPAFSGIGKVYYISINSVVGVISIVKINLCAPVQKTQVI